MRAGAAPDSPPPECFGGDYYELFIAALEREAETLDIENMRILTDRELLKQVEEAKAAK